MNSLKDWENLQDLGFYLEMLHHKVVSIGIFHHFLHWSKCNANFETMRISISLYKDNFKKCWGKFVRKKNVTKRLKKLILLQSFSKM